MNEEIRDREVRVIDQNGEQLGVQPIRKALELAEEAGLDLVKIVPTAKPPVCKLMDYDKYRYEQAKKEREIRRNQKFRNSRYISKLVIKNSKRTFKNTKKTYKKWV